MLDTQTILALIIAALITLAGIAPSSAADNLAP